MAQISISGDSSGAISIAAPAVAGSYTLTLPQITGTINTLNSGTAQNTTSGTSIDFTNLPANLRRITISLNAVSTNSGSNYMIQLGTPSIATSGYVGTITTLITGVSLNNTYTNGFNFTNPSGASASMYGQCFLTLVSGNTWIFSSSIADQGGRVFLTQGGITLGGTLSTVRLTTNNGTDTFDAGSVNILYE